MLWEFLSVTELHPGLVLFSLLFLFLPVTELNMLFKIHVLILHFYFHWSFYSWNTCPFVLQTWSAAVCCFVFSLKTLCSFLKVSTDCLPTPHFKHYVQGSKLRCILFANLSFVERCCKHSWHFSHGPVQWFVDASFQFFPPALYAYHPPDKFVQKLCCFVSCFPSSLLITCSP